MASRARWASLLSYVAVLAWLCAVSYWLVTVSRAPLPLEAIAALAAAVRERPVPAARIRFRVAPGSLGSAEVARAFSQRLLRALAAAGVEVVEASGGEAEVPGSVAALRACAEATAERAPGSLEACLEARGAAEEAAAAALAADFEMLVVPGPPGSAAVLTLDTGHAAVLHCGEATNDSYPEALADAVVARLQETWLRPLSFDDKVTTLFEVAPAYVFSFLLVGDCRRRVAWDFRGSILDPYLKRFLAHLQLLADVELDSQVIQCGSLADVVGVVDAAALQADFLRKASDWPPDIDPRPMRWMPPLVRLVAFAPSVPVRVVDDQRRPQRSFGVQGWGVVAMAGANVDDVCPAVEEATCGGNGTVAAGMVSACEAQQVASAWISSLRSWLTLPPDSPVPAESHNWSWLELRAAAPSFIGITSWELLLVSRAFHRLFLSRTVETLENFAELIDSLPDVRVRAEISDMVHEAAALCRRSADLAAAGERPAALAAARAALQLALGASHDDSVVAEMYFSWEFKYAVYLPLFFPLILPVIFSLLRQTRHARDVRKALHKAAGTANEQPPEVS